MEEAKEFCSEVRESANDEDGMSSGNFYADEKLFRAVTVDNPNMFDQHNQVTSTVFKDSAGVSVDRQWHRSVKEAVNALCNKLAKIQGRKIKDYKVISVKKSDCDSVRVHCQYAPEDNDIYHSLIMQSSTEIKLTKTQARKLVKLAIVENI